MGEKFFLQLRGLLLIHCRNAGKGIGQLHGLVFEYAQLRKLCKLLSSMKDFIRKLFA